MNSFNEYMEFYMGESVRNNLPAWDDTTLSEDSINHILDNHTYYRRMAIMLSNSDISRFNQTMFNLDKKEYKDIVHSIRNKLKNDTKLNSLEESIIDNAYKHDVDENGNTRKDFYPLNMTESDIVKTIRDSYKNAKKISKRKYQEEKKYLEHFGWIYDGKIIYEGISNGLVIHFWYNFDWNEIETAYPVYDDRKIKKHK